MPIWRHLATTKSETILGFFTIAFATHVNIKYLILMIFRLHVNTKACRIGPEVFFFIVKYTFFAFSCEKLGHQKIADCMATTRTLLSLVVVTCACTEMVAMTTSESKERVSFVAKQRAFA